MVWPKTTVAPCSSAQLCRDNEWQVGVELEAEVHERDDCTSRGRIHRHRIRLTAIGRTFVLAELIAVDSVSVEGCCGEMPLDLHARDWRRVEP